MKKPNIPWWVLLVLLLLLMIFSIKNATGQSLKHSSTWNNQKPIDVGSPGVQVGYNCRIIDATYHGVNIGYTTRWGFEMGINTYNYYERLETLKNLQFMEVYAKYRIFNLPWENGYVNMQLTWSDSKYMFDNRDDAIGKRLMQFSCSAGISQIFSPKQLRLEFLTLYTQQGKKGGLTIGLIKRI